MSRSDHTKEHIGLTSWHNALNGKIVKADVLNIKKQSSETCKLDNRVLKSQIVLELIQSNVILIVKEQKCYKNILYLE